jgi:hypothetical protein
MAKIIANDESLRTVAMFRLDGSQVVIKKSSKKYVRVPAQDAPSMLG